MGILMKVLVNSLNCVLVNKTLVTCHRGTVKQRKSG